MLGIWLRNQLHLHPTRRSRLRRLVQLIYFTILHNPFSTQKNTVSTYLPHQIQALGLYGAREMEKFQKLACGGRGGNNNRRQPNLDPHPPTYSSEWICLGVHRR